MHSLRDPAGVLDAVAADPTFEWVERFVIARALDDICSSTVTGLPGPARLGLPRMTYLIPGHDIAVTYELANPSVYPTDRAGVYLIDISRI